MGWQYSPTMDTEAQQGDCCRDCEHTDCIASRAWIESRCTICGERIGEGVPMYLCGRQVVHATCAQREAQE